ncbi:MAG: DUF1360 domain-containing protein, partial [Verrucomicrobia bacterium]|nr:DUF1360 domain-containing protein [Verrucomicrobiota bacterium]
MNSTFTAQAKAKQVSRGYGENQPLPHFSLLIGIQLTIFSILAILAGRRPYPAIRIGDLLLLAIGTHKLSRIVAKDRVTAPIRAPFTRFKEGA